MTISFVIPGAPQAKQRAQMSPMSRCRSCGRKTTRRECPHCGDAGVLEFLTNIPFTPKDTVLYENLVGLCAREAIRGSIFSGAVEIHAVAFFPVPKTRAKKIEEGQPHTQRPDADNCLKSLCDGSNGVLWTDDCIVWKKSIEKRWTHGEPRMEVEVSGCELITRQVAPSRSEKVGMVNSSRPSPFAMKG